jgi:hypothetical protein
MEQFPAVRGGGFQVYRQSIAAGPLHAIPDRFERRRSALNCLRLIRIRTLEKFTGYLQPHRLQTCLGFI